MRTTVFFHPQNDYTGSTRVLANVIEKDYVSQNVQIVTLNPSKGFLSELSNVQIVSIYPFLLKGKNVPLISSVLRRIYALILAWYYGKKNQVFYINTIVPSYAAIVGRLLHKQIVYHIHEKFVIRSFGVKLAEYVFNHTRAKRIFVSNFLKNQYESLSGCEEVVIYNTLSKAFLDRVQIRPLEERTRRQILMITSLFKAKGLDTFVQIARLLPNLSFRLVISADAQAINDFFSGYEFPQNLELVPKQSDIHTFLYTSDLILNLTNPAYWIETFGMTILEAMVYGIPAIVPNIGGPCELVLNGYNGFCIDVTDVNCIIEAINKSLSVNLYDYLCVNSLERSKLFV